MDRGTLPNGRSQASKGRKASPLNSEARGPLHSPRDGTE